jgi:hypothetical protein
MRPVVLTLLTIFAMSIAILFLLSERYPNLPLATEIAKAVLQLGVVSVVGTVVSLLIFEYQRERTRMDRERDIAQQTGEKDRDLERLELEKKRDLHAKKVEYRESLLLGVLSKSHSAYSKSKKARRLLRAKAKQMDNDGNEILLAQGYDEYMDLVNDAQLELENLARDVATSGVAFSSPGDIVASLRQMDKYFGNLIEEYENRRPLFPADRPIRSLVEHPRLVEYLRSAEDSEFMTQVVHPYHKVQERIRKDLLHPMIPAVAADA